MNKRILLVLALLLASLCAVSGPAHAAGCAPSFNGSTHVLTIGSCWSDPDAPTIARISRTAGGAIRLDGQAIPGGPTVTNTDKVVYDGNDGELDEITIDMSNGSFAPGYSPDNVGKNEIEFDINGGSDPTNFLTILGTAENDVIRIGASGIDLDDDNDSDVARTHLGGRVTVDGQGGLDQLYGTGIGSSDPSTAPLALRGGPDRDWIFGGLANDALDGGADVDWLCDEYAAFTLTDTTLTGNGTDTLTGFEKAYLFGTSGPDTIDASAFTGGTHLVGGDGSDVVIGGPNDDVLQGMKGDDALHGGPGDDQVSEVVTAPAVLTNTSLTGRGADSLDSIESAYLAGTSVADTIDASAFAGSATLLGLKGDDALVAAAAGSDLKGGDGDDRLTGGPGLDSFDGGAGDDVAISRDELTEQVTCGGGADTAIADALDGLTGCERIDRDGGGAAAGPDADVVAPALSKLALARRAVRFRVSERATVRLTLMRAKRGHWVRTQRTMTYAAAAGPNRVVLRGRLARRALAAGRYRLVARATDAAGNRSAPRRAAFRIAGASL